MINLSVRTKAAILAFSIAVSSSNVFCSETSSFNLVKDFIVTNKGALCLSTLAGLLVAGEVLLLTDQRVTYNYDNWTEDVKEFLSAFNVFNAESRAIIKRFIKKYFVGARLRLDDVTTRTKEENGAVITVKRKKLSQKPSGFMGLLDAYIFTQMKTIAEFMTPAATVYALIINPLLMAQKEYNKSLDIKSENGAKPVTNTEYIIIASPEEVKRLFDAKISKSLDTEAKIV